MLDLIYTTGNAVRSVVGLDEQDFSDQEMDDRLLPQELQLDLSSWLPAHKALYFASKGSADQTLATGLELYSTYFSALNLVPALKLKAIQSVSDGKNALERFAQINWDQLKTDLAGKTAQYKQVVAQAASLADQGEIITPKLFTAVGLGTDPVTNT